MGRSIHILSILTKTQKNKKIQPKTVTNIEHHPIVPLLTHGVGLKNPYIFQLDILYNIINKIEYRTGVQFLAFGPGVHIRFQATYRT